MKADGKTYSSVAESQAATNGSDYGGCVARRDGESACRAALVPNEPGGEQHHTEGQERRAPKKTPNRVRSMSPEGNRASIAQAVHVSRMALRSAMLTSTAQLADGAIMP